MTSPLKAYLGRSLDVLKRNTSKGEYLSLHCTDSMAHLLHIQSWLPILHPIEEGAT